MKPSGTGDIFLPDRAIYTFKGWIPTIVGRLSFRSLIQPPYPDRTQARNWTTGDQQIIAIEKRRNLSDCLLLRDFHLSTDFWYVFLAQRVEEDQCPARMTGWIFVYAGSQRWANGRYDLGRLYDALDRCREAGRLPDQLDEHTLGIRHYSDLVMRVHLWQSGLCQIEYHEDDQLYFKRPLLVDDELTDAESKHDTETQKKEVHYIASQSFYFMRDITHYHQHHDPRTDTMVTLFWDDDDRWAIKTFDVLFEKVIHFKRDKSVVAIHSSLGVLAYLQSFSRLFSARLLPRQIETLEGCDGLRKSLEAALEEQKLKYSTDRNKATHQIVMIGLAAFTALITTIFLLSLTDYRLELPGESQNLFAVLANNALGCPTITFGVLGMLLSAPWLAKRIDSYGYEVRSKYSDELLRLSLAFKRYREGLVFIFIIALVFLIIIPWMIFELNLIAVDSPCWESGPKEQS